MKINYKYRNDQPEIMDDLNCDGEIVYQTLREIAFINKTLGGNHVTLDGLKSLLKNEEKREYSIADLGCGGGEMLNYICKWGKNNDFNFQLNGIDTNPHIIEFARENAGDYNFLCEDVTSSTFRSQKYDIITCTLFAHHFSSEQLIELLAAWLHQVNLGIVINDLHRHPLAYHSIRILTSLFSKSDMVKYDAPLSVLRGFVRDDWEYILEGANIKKYSLEWKWAFRWKLVIFK